MSAGHSGANTERASFITGSGDNASAVGTSSDDYRFAPPHILVSEGEVVVGGSDGVLVGLDPATGETVWQRQLSGVVRGIARSGDDVFAGNQDGQLFAVRLSSSP